MLQAKLLSILLAGIMVCGSIPLGFSEPLLQQWKNTNDINELSCDNTDHVLVIRDNGTPACVTEKSAQKVGWEIIHTTTEISSRIIPTTSNGVPASLPNGVITIEISKIPVLGETFTITLGTIFDEFWYAENGAYEDNVGIELYGFEIVSIDPVFVNYSTEQYNGYDVAKSSSNVNLTQPQEFQYTITAKPTKLDYASISFDGLLEDKAKSTLWIGTDKSYYYSDVKYDFLDVVEIVDDDWIYTVNANVEFNPDYSITDDEIQNGYKGRTIEELNQANIPLIYNTTSFQVDLTNLTSMQQDIIFERYNNLDLSIDQVRQSITMYTILPTETIMSLIAQIPPRISQEQMSSVTVENEYIPDVEPLLSDEQIANAPVQTPEQERQDVLRWFGELSDDDINYNYTIPK